MRSWGSFLILLWQRNTGAAARLRAALTTAVAALQLDREAAAVPPLVRGHLDAQKR